jgi:hypothetical protein
MTEGAFSDVHARDYVSRPAGNTLPGTRRRGISRVPVVIVLQDRKRGCHGAESLLLIRGRLADDRAAQDHKKQQEELCYLLGSHVVRECLRSGLGSGDNGLGSGTDTNTLECKLLSSAPVSSQQRVGT